MVPVPDLIGAAWDVAREIGGDAGLWVTAPDPDGPPLAQLGWPGGVVVAQRPQPGVRVPRGSTLTVWVEQGPGSAGVREPRRAPGGPPLRHAEAPLPNERGLPPGVAAES